MRPVDVAGDCGFRRREKSLVVLGCSATKVPTAGFLPAISLYDGPAFRVLRAFLREYHWPTSLSVAVLSAKYGLVGALSHLTSYNQQLTPDRARELAPAVTDSLLKLVPSHGTMTFVLGRQYLHAIEAGRLCTAGVSVTVAEGSIGIKLEHLYHLLRSTPCHPRRAVSVPTKLSRPLYFLPDWDDFVDAQYDFENDRFSSSARSSRQQQHSTALVYPRRLCDGVLVSLAQHLGSKGVLRRVGGIDEGSLAPRSVRDFFKLQSDQWAFGDCGAFSYASEHNPTISVEQAVSLYDLYDFDLGASVDHIPLEVIRTPAGKTKLSDSERRRRVTLTRDNADRFLKLHRERGARFIPVGVIQGLTPEDYARQLHEYLEMGYTFVALGGLVPRNDADVLAIAEAVSSAVNRARKKPWVHLLGIFRPRLQAHFRRLGIGSFDSATYFRKSWLRSDQNYLAVDGQWYAAIRVPPTTDPRTLVRLKRAGVSEDRIRQCEADALQKLHRYDRGLESLEACLEAVLEYDRLLSRREALSTDLAAAYRRTLEQQPWKRCPCNVCGSLGIDVVIFRGLNRNKRRGAHNTLQLFDRLHRW